jgi:alginate O-acetyltransferase complex protein AlgI
MVEFGSTHFWIVSVVLILMVRVVQPRPELRRWFFLAATTALYAWKPATALAMLSVAAYGWVVMGRAKSPTMLIIHVGVLSLILNLGLGHSEFTGALGLESIVPLIGIPYVYLRVIHLWLEARNSRITPPGVVDYLTYMFPFHMLYAGPIERYSEYREAMYRDIPDLTDQVALQALNRITDGLVKLFVLAELLVKSLGFEFARSGLPLWLEVDLYLVQFYLNFSGYMDIMIGIGMLAGWTPPENFNWPFSARNIIEFWTRWHITLSLWARDYIFIPVNMALQPRLPRKFNLIAGSVGYFLVMLFVGWWHKPNLNFVLWGAIYGVGMIACKLYQDFLKRVLSRRGLKAYRESRLIYYVASFATFQFSALNLLFAMKPIPDAMEIIARCFGIE